MASMQHAVSQNLQKSKQAVVRAFKNRVVGVKRFLVKSMGDQKAEFLRLDSLMKQMENYDYKTDSKYQELDYQLRNLFYLLDVDRSGELTDQEIKYLEHFWNENEEELDYHYYFPADRTKFPVDLPQFIEALRPSAKKNLINFKMCTAQSGKYTPNPSFLVLLVMAELTAAAGFLYFYSITLFWILVGIIAGVFLFGRIWHPNFWFRLYESVKGLNRIFPGVWLVPALSFAAAIIEMNLFWHFFQIAPQDGYSETTFPWEVNLLCLAGIGVITCWAVDEESILARNRDMLLLGLYKFHNSELLADDSKSTKRVKSDDLDEERVDEDDLDNSRSESIKNAGQLLYRIYSAVDAADRKQPRISISTLFCLAMHVCGALILPAFHLFSPFLLWVQRWPFFLALIGGTTSGNDNAVNTYHAYMEANARNTDYPELVYYLCLGLGSISVFLSTVTYELYIRQATHEPFDRCYQCMKYLLATSDLLESSSHQLPYCQLDRRPQLTVFSEISEYLRLHDQGTMMGQALTGFASILLVDVVIVASLVGMFVTKSLSLRVLTIFAFYSLWCTYWCFRLLYKAVKINQVHERTLVRLIEYQRDVALIERDGQTEIYDMLERLHNSLAATFKPVTVLGIPATPTLMKVFIGYLVTGVITMAGSYIYGG